MALVTAAPSPDAGRPAGDDAAFRPLAALCGHGQVRWFTSVEVIELDGAPQLIVEGNAEPPAGGRVGVDVHPRRRPDRLAAAIPGDLAARRDLPQAVAVHSLIE